MVGYWPLDGNGDEVVNAFTGVLVGNVSFVNGKVGLSAELDGDGSYIDAGVHSELTEFGGNQMSVSAWVYREEHGPGTENASAVITSRTNCNEGNFQLYDDLAPNVYFSKWLNGNEDQTFADFAVPKQQWTHITATYAANEVRFYKDGTYTNSVTPLQFGGDINDFLQNVQLGWDSCGAYFTGKLDEVTLHDVTLTDQEVMDMYLQGVTGKSICQNDPATKSECKNEGWQGFGFKNQGNCIQFVNTGKDKRGV